MTYANPFRTPGTSAPVQTRRQPVELSAEAQAAIATRVRDELQQLVDGGVVRAYEGSKVTTAITPMREFTPAEESHQRYLEKHPNGYCNHRIRIKEWPMIVEK